MGILSAAVGSECRFVMKIVIVGTGSGVPHSCMVEPRNRNPFHEQREWMVERQIEGRGVNDPRVLAAMRSIPRDRFVPEPYRSLAYEDSPLPIGHDQTISQPYIVALMTQYLELTGTERVLEIGTGCGYQTAILARCAAEVYSIEIVPALSRHATRILSELNIENVHLRTGDGYQGWIEAAPFDAIMLTAAPRNPPSPLLEQLNEGGRMILPVGEFTQELVLITREEGKIFSRVVEYVRFVPMTGEAQQN